MLEGHGPHIPMRSALGVPSGRRADPPRGGWHLPNDVSPARSARTCHASNRGILPSSEQTPPRRGGMCPFENVLGGRGFRLVVVWSKPLPPVRVSEDTRTIRHIAGSQPRGPAGKGSTSWDARYSISSPAPARGLPRCVARERPGSFGTTQTQRPRARIRMNPFLGDP